MTDDELEPFMRRIQDACIVVILLGVLAWLFFWMA